MATVDALRLLQQYLAPYAQTPPPRPQMGPDLQQQMRRPGSNDPGLLEALTGARSRPYQGMGPYEYQQGAGMAAIPPDLWAGLPDAVKQSLARPGYQEGQRAPSMFAPGRTYSNDDSAIRQENLSQDPHSRERLPEELNFRRMAPQLDEPTREGEILRPFFPQYEAQGSPYPWQNSLNSMLFPPFVNY